MSEFEAVLEHARQLSLQEQTKLIVALWDAVPADAELPLHPDWESELGRRVMELNSGKATTIPWTTIRAEALARIGHDANS